MSIDDSNESQSSEKVCARQVTKTPYFTHSQSSVEMAMFSSFNRGGFRKLNSHLRLQ